MDTLNNLMSFLISTNLALIIPALIVIGLSLSVYLRKSKLIKPLGYSFLVFTLSFLSIDTYTGHTELNLKQASEQKA